MTNPRHVAAQALLDQSNAELMDQVRKRNDDFWLLVELLRDAIRAMRGEE